jgi:hypothetical protein
MSSCGATDRERTSDPGARTRWGRSARKAPPFAVTTRSCTFQGEVERPNVSIGRDDDALQDDKAWVTSWSGKTISVVRYGRQAAVTARRANNLNDQLGLRALEGLDQAPVAQRLAHSSWIAATS